MKTTAVKSLARPIWLIQASGAGGMFGCYSFVVAERVLASSAEDAFERMRRDSRLLQAKRDDPNATFSAVEYWWLA